MGSGPVGLGEMSFGEQVVFMEIKGSVGFHAGGQEKPLGLKFKKMGEAAGKERIYLRAPRSWDQALPTDVQPEGHGDRDQPLSRGLDAVTSTGPFWFGDS